jgi:hypothetical protein
VHKFGDFAIGILYIAAIFLLVRPGSQGPKLVTTFGESLSNVLTTVTGGSGWNG